MKKTIFLFAIVAFIASQAFASQVHQIKFSIKKKEAVHMSKKVLFILAEDPFRDPEYFEPRKVIENAGHKVTTTCTAPVAKGAEGATVKVDVLFKDVKASDYDAIVFIGGAGSYQYHNDKKAHELAIYGAKTGKVLGAICASVGTIANAGVLKGKKATSFSGVSDMVKAGGAIYTGAGVTVDGNIVTADGPRSAKAFGEALVKVLSK